MPYMSPELREACDKGECNVNLLDYEKSDIFSLGITFLQAYLLISKKETLK